MIRKNLSWLVTLEILNLAFVFLGGHAGWEGSQVFSFPALRVYFP